MTKAKSAAERAREVARQNPVRSRCAYLTEVPEAREIVEAMAEEFVDMGRKPAYRVIWEHLTEVHPQYPYGVPSIEKWLREHRPDLYRPSKR